MIFSGIISCGEKFADRSKRVRSQVSGFHELFLDTTLDPVLQTVLLSKESTSLSRNLLLYDHFIDSVSLFHCLAQPVPKFEGIFIGDVCRHHHTHRPSQARTSMSLQNGYANGGTAPTMAVPGPRVIEVPLKEEAGATLEIDCETLEEDTSELCEILNSEEVSLKFWIKFAVMPHARCECADAGSLSIIGMGWWTMPLICCRRASIVCYVEGLC